ncbi:NACHT domain-containing protein [Actinomadura litoris]|nr:NACHT domain-containing protein [Actinomadura litoris]
MTGQHTDDDREGAEREGTERIADEVSGRSRRDLANGADTATTARRAGGPLAKYVFGVLTAGLAMVSAAVASNQILNDDKWALKWVLPALAFTTLGLVVTAAPERAVAVPRRVSRREYRRRVHASTEQMETVGVVTQAEYVLRTRQVYVDVALQPLPVTQASSDTGVGRPSGVAPQEAGVRVSLASFLAPARVLAVLGAAGSGKTTLARYTALDLAEREWRPWRHRFWRRRPLPLLLYLRDHAETILTGSQEGGRRIGLADAAAAARWLDGVVTAGWLERQLGRDRCVVLLDGLDEVADGADRKRVVDWVERQIARYPGNAFVITSRPHGYEDNRLANAEILRVQRFTTDQIREFLHAWYRAIEHRARQGDRTQIDRDAAAAAQDLFDRVNALPALYDLAANPLLLTMIANVHRYGGQLPAGRAALYAEICLVLVHRRQDVRDIIIDPKVDALTGQQKQLIVQELAWHMMRHKLRDISITEASRAVRAVLRRTNPDLAPEVFLNYVRRVGLLAEHRYGHYGFVHLTLQEHLAAESAREPRHEARRQLLITSVNDPWWRETILLWAAGTDATPLVQACLQARSVNALSLAYALDAQAREIDPDLREQLNQILPLTPTNPEEARLLDGIAADRLLHTTHSLPGGTRLCATPVTTDLWNRYTAHTNAPPIVSGTTQGPWSADIQGLLTWLNALNPDTPYRLPTPQEAHQAFAQGHHPDLTAIWASTPGQTPSLVLHPGQPHPYVPTAEKTRNLPDLIAACIWPLIHLVHRASPHPLSRLLRYGRPRNLSDPIDQVIHVLDLLLALNRALDTARNFDHTLALDPDRDLNQVLDRDRALNLALDLARDLDRNLARALKLASDLDLDLALSPARALDLARAFARDLARALHNAHDLARDLARARGLALDRAYDLARAPALDSARDLERVLGHARDLARDLDPDLGLEIDRNIGLDVVLDIALEVDRAVDRDLDDDFDLALDHDLAVDLALDLARDLALALALDRDLDRDLARDLALDRDLALGLDRGLDRDLAVARMVGTVLDDVDLPTQFSLARSCVDLVGHYFANVDRRTPRPGRTRQPALGAGFRLFLTHELDKTGSFRSPADDPTAVLQRLINVQNSNPAPLAPEVDRMLKGALRLLDPLVERSRPIRPTDLVFASMLVMAAISRLQEKKRVHVELIRELTSTLATLIALISTTPTGVAVVLARA